MSRPPEVWRGFADPVLEAQSVFRSIMTAMARPGTIADLASEGLNPPRPLTPGLAAVALALCDHETPIWLDTDLAAAQSVARYLQFHTGAPLVAEPADAAFVFAVALNELPLLTELAQGSDEYPDRSTTLVLAVAALGSGRALTLAGPGIKERATLALMPSGDDIGHLQSQLGLLEDLITQLDDNHARFPRGVDCIFVARDKLAALPRSTRILKDASEPEAMAGVGA